jgi:hypothetical protein
VNLRITRPPPHGLSVEIQQDASDEPEADSHGHQQQDRRDEAAFDSPVIDEVCHSKLLCDTWLAKLSIITVKV